MPWGDDATRFLHRVLPWPQGTDPGYVNIHWTKPNTSHPKARDYFNGKAFRTLDDAINFLRWVAFLPDTTNVYFCTSLQRQTVHNKNGKEIALRAKENTICSKALFLDLDVKENGGYASIKEAYADLVRFYKAVELPPPSAIVASGSGLHVYWFSNRPLQPDEWQTLAGRLRGAATKFGLKFDSQCTIDMARVLRVPETRNGKTSPAKQVGLLYLSEQDYDFAVLVTPVLTNVEVANEVTHQPTRTLEGVSSGWTSPDDTLFPQREVPDALKHCVGEGNSGIDNRSSNTFLTLPQQEVIFSGCRFLGRAREEGGASYSNPLWMLSVLAVSFMDGGRALAHEISRGHASYTEEDTDALYARKVADHERGIGWPSCKAIEGAGCKDCGACVLRGRIKGPLNLGTSVPTAAPTVGAMGAGNGAVPITGWQLPQLYPGYSRYELPEGYAFNQAGAPCIVLTEKETSKDGQVGTRTTLVPLLQNQILLDPVVQASPHGLNFKVVGKLGEIREVFVTRGLCYTPGELNRSLGDQGVAVAPQAKAKMGDFLMSLCSKVESIIKSLESRPFGWSDDMKSFSFGGKVFFEDGTELPTGHMNQMIKAKFSPRGDLEPWIKAAQFIIDTGQPELILFLATAFAAPLMAHTEQTVMGIVLYGDSGKGKSHALKTAQAAWGHPKDARLPKDQTYNAVSEHLAALCNLPAYWDDVENDPDRLKVKDSIFTDGRGKGRLGVSRGSGAPTLQPIGKWSTMVCITTNMSFLEWLNVNQPDTSAGRKRMFEVVATAKTVDDMFVGNEILAPLNNNFGNAGMIYAKFLATNASKIAKMITDKGREFNAKVSANNTERYWSVACACFLVGAQFAKDLGLVNFDMEKFEAYLIQQYHKQQVLNDEGGQEGGEAAMSLLSNFLKEHLPATLITKTVPSAGISSGIEVLRAPLPQYSHGLAVQWSVYPSPKLRVSDDQLQQWLLKRKRSASAISRRLKHRKMRRSKLGAGTGHSCNEETLIEFDASKGTEFYGVLNDMLGGKYDDDKIAA